MLTATGHLHISFIDFIFSWPLHPTAAQNISTAPHPPVTSAPPVQVSMEGLPAAPDLNLPDPDVLVNQLGMLVTAAEDESMRNEEHSTNQGKHMAGVTDSMLILSVDPAITG